MRTGRALAAASGGARSAASTDDGEESDVVRMRLSEFEGLFLLFIASSIVAVLANELTNRLIIPWRRRVELRSLMSQTEARGQSKADVLQGMKEKKAALETTKLWDLKGINQDNGGEMIFRLMKQLKAFRSESARDASDDEDSDNTDLATQMTANAKQLFTISAQLASVLERLDQGAARGPARKLDTNGSPRSMEEAVQLASRLDPAEKDALYVAMGQPKPSAYQGQALNQAPSNSRLQYW